MIIRFIPPNTILPSRRWCFYYAAKEDTKMIVLSWICFITTALFVFFAFIGVFAKRMAEDRVISFVALIYYATVLYLLLNAYL